MYTYVYICIDICMCMYVHIYMYIYIYVYMRHEIRICCNGIGCVSPKTASTSNHTIICVNTMICVNASLWCGRKVKDCIITICALPLTLCTAWICPFFPCPPMCVCIIRHIYIHAHTRMMIPNTLIMSANVNAYNSWHQVCVSRTIATNYWIQAWWPPTHT